MSLWTPKNIPLIGWYDASDSTTITESAGAVSQLDDKSGNSNHLVQATGSAQPTTGARTQSGLNVLDCDGGDFMYSNSVPFGSNEDFSVYLVAEIDSVDSEFDSVFSMQVPGGSSARLQLQADNATQFDGSIIGVLPCTGGPFPGPSIYCLYNDYNGVDRKYVFIDGFVRLDSAGGSTGIVGSQDITVFSDRNKTQFLNGCFGEYIIVSESDTEDRYKIEGYLAHKWGLESNLPSNHPYRYTAPMTGGGIAKRHEEDEFGYS